MLQALKPLARRGKKEAVDALAGPPFPWALDYLWEWFLQLDVSRGASSPVGINPLTNMDIAAWMTVRQRVMQEHEVEAMFVLDVVMRNPDAMKEEE